MAAGKHVVIWPKVRVSVKGKSQVVEQGSLLPAGVSDADLENLTSFGAVAGVRETKVAPATDPGSTTETAKGETKKAASGGSGS